MALMDKYRPLVELVNQLGIKDYSAKEEGGVLKLSGTVNTPYEKNLVWDKIKAIGGEAHTDLNADVKVANSSYFHLHKVAKGENLSVIAKKYFGNANKYMEIYNTNKDILKNPDLIQIGQDLKIPFPSK
jgi:nucleoid-associated protein YgaU